MDDGMWQEAVDSLVKENNRLTEKLMLLEDTNAMLSSEWALRLPKLWFV